MANILGIRIWDKLLANLKSRSRQIEPLTSKIVHDKNVYSYTMRNNDTATYFKVIKETLEEETNVAPVITGRSAGFAITSNLEKNEKIIVEAIHPYDFLTEKLYILDKPIYKFKCDTSYCFYDKLEKTLLKKYNYNYKCEDDQPVPYYRIDYNQLLPGKTIYIGTSDGRRINVLSDDESFVKSKTYPIAMKISTICAMCLTDLWLVMSLSEYFLY